MGDISGAQIGQILGMVGGTVIGQPGLGGTVGGAIGGAIDPQTGLPLPVPPAATSDPAAQQDQSSAQLQANAVQPQGPDPNAQLLQILLMLANQGPRS